MMDCFLGNPIKIEDQNIFGRLDVTILLKKHFYCMQSL